MTIMLSTKYQSWSIRLLYRLIGFLTINYFSNRRWNILINAKQTELCVEAKTILRFCNQFGHSTTIISNALIDPSQPTSPKEQHTFPSTLGNLFPLSTNICCVQRPPASGLWMPCVLGIFYAPQVCELVWFGRNRKEGRQACRQARSWKTKGSVIANGFANFHPDVLVNESTGLYVVGRLLDGWKEEVLYEMEIGGGEFAKGVNWTPCVMCPPPAPLDKRPCELLSTLRFPSVSLCAEENSVFLAC